MSQGERHAVNGVGTIPRTAEPTANGTRTSHEPFAERAWETLFPLLKSAKQLQLDAGKTRDANGTKPATENRSADPFRSLIQQILTHDPPTIEPLPFVEPVELLDGELDRAQADAVARALQCTDLLLIQGLPGTGKSRTAVELIRQAIARGRRVLLTARTGSAIDAILSQLQPLAEFEMVRLPGKDENEANLAPSLSRCLATAREQSVCKSIIEQARLRERHLDCRLQVLRQLAPVWVRLRDLVQRADQLKQQRADLWLRKAAIESDVRRAAVESTDPAYSDLTIERFRSQISTHTQWVANWEAQRVELQKQHGQAEDECRAARERQSSLRALADAARSGRFWSLRFWKVRADTSLPQRLDDAQKQVAECEQALLLLQQRQEKEHKARADAETAYAAECERLIAEACRAREREIDERLAAIDTETRQIVEWIDRQLELLPPEVLRPDIRSIECIHTAEAAFDELIRGLDQARHLAGEWRAFAETEGDLIARGWRESVGVVAAPVSALSTDEWFARSLIPSDLAVVVNAHELSENDIMQAGRRAKHLILFGEPALPSILRNVPKRHVARPASTRRARPTPDFFATLWDRLHHEMWTHADGRLCCQLHRVPAPERGQLEKESVADRPDVELRIWNGRNGEPVLAEVHFPATMSIGEARQYLFQELGEIPCAPRFRTGRWEAADNELWFRIGPIRSGPLPPRRIALAEGVALRIDDHRHDDSEIAVVFDGWGREPAEAWLHRHLHARDAGRACRLERSYRHSPPLAEWLNEAIFADAPTMLAPANKAAVEFIPVPRRRLAHARGRGGAGIEIDLADSEQRAQLPRDLAAILPARGYVNLAEARAVADLLPRLARGHRIVVAAPYAAQAELLRQFCPTACVEHTDNLTHAECDFLVVSLTRSHVARAVTYGDDPLIMLRLLPLARCRILFVGDPGTLARRASWEGAIDHLDETDGERERRWVQALLPFLPARILHPAARVPQGAPV